MKKIIIISLVIISLLTASVAGSSVMKQKESEKNKENLSKQSNYSSKDLRICPVWPPQQLSLSLKGEGYEEKSRSKLELTILNLIKTRLVSLFERFLNIFQISPKISLDRYRGPSQENVKNDENSEISINSPLIEHLELTGDGTFKDTKANNLNPEYAITKEFTLTNICDQTEDGYIYMKSSGGFYITKNGGDFSLDPGESMPIEVMFWPRNEQSYSGELRVDWWDTTPRNGKNVDLEILSVEPIKSEDPRDLGTYHIQWEIINSGEGKAYLPEKGMIKEDGKILTVRDKISWFHWSIKYYLDPNSDMRHNWDNILEPGENLIGTTFYMPSFAPGSQYTLTIDPFDYVPETNEDNNQVTIRIPLS